MVLVPVGRGNWRRLVLEIPAPADMFPAVRDQHVREREQWFMAARWWWIVEVRP